LSNKARTSDIVVIGIGNLIRSDDGLGIHALRRLVGDPKLPPGVDLIDGGTKGLELVSYAWDASRLLLLDSVDAGKSPGTLIRMNGDELLSLRPGKSVHQLGVVDLVSSVYMAFEKIPDIVLLGAQPASTNWGPALTGAVERVLDSLVETALELLRSWSQADQAP